MEGIRRLLDTSDGEEGTNEKPIEEVATTFINNAVRTLRLARNPELVFVRTFYQFWRGIRSEACFEPYLYRSQEDVLHCVTAMRVPIPAGLREAIHKLQLRGAAWVWFDG